MDYENSWTSPGEGFLKEYTKPVPASKVRAGWNLTPPYDLKDISKLENPFDIYIGKAVGGDVTKANQAGAKKADLELKKTLQKAVKQKTFAAARSMMQKVQNKHRKYGADDTEPSFIITDILNQIYGTDHSSRESVEKVSKWTTKIVGHTPERDF